ncbi:MAG TPA: glycosyl hydrolase-related protein, partial [Phycisphaerae bacterium]
DYEAAGAVVRAGRDWLPHACLDWFAVEDFVRLRDPNNGFSVVWTTPDAPLMELQDINTHKWLSALPIHNGRVYSYFMNNYWHTNYKAAQEGRFVFRYSITSGANICNAAAAHFARPWSPQVEESLAQLVAVNNPHVQVMALKRADDGRGYVLRLREMDGTHGDATVTIGALGHRTASAAPANGIEWSCARENELRSTIEDGKLRVHLHPYQIATWRVVPEE